MLVSLYTLRPVQKTMSLFMHDHVQTLLLFFSQYLGLLFHGAVPFEGTLAHYGIENSVLRIGNIRHPPSTFTRSSHLAAVEAVWVGQAHTISVRVRSTPYLKQMTGDLSN